MIWPFAKKRKGVPRELEVESQAARARHLRAVKELQLALQGHAGAVADDIAKGFE